MVIDDVFAVISEQTRRDILDSLRAGDKAVGQLVEELGASQPTISKHLRVLREASLVTMRAEGQKRFYSLNTVPLQRVSGWINAFDGGPGSAGPDGHRPVPALAEATGPNAGPQSDANPGPFANPGPSTKAGPLTKAEPAAGPGTAVVVPGTAEDDAAPDGTRQLGRSVGRAANKAADLLANLPKFGRRKE
ncbi:MAG: metalloregulator ArsR/SmtB family transcription factor [Actinomycetota bacterium]|nr:metalloregulator ArsR/SmtB family transcription factor [Actinomycetota bacterium]